MSEKRKTGPQTRRGFHLSRIRAEKNGVLRFWWAAWWVMAELKQLGKRDQAKAHATGLHLAEQLTVVARDLNTQHQDQLKPPKGGSHAV